jgi:hypothetical protein
LKPPLSMTAHEEKLPEEMEETPETGKQKRRGLIV